MNNFSQEELQEVLIRKLSSGEITREQAAQAVAEFKAVKPTGNLSSPTGEVLSEQEERGFFENAYEGVKDFASDAYDLAKEVPGIATELPGAIYEQATGEERTTPEIQALPSYIEMPELDEFGFDMLKTAAGTITTDPKETAQIIKANFPHIEISNDSKGNFIFKSKDGKQYGIKPGFSFEEDFPKVLAPIAEIVATVGTGGAQQAGKLVNMIKTGFQEAGIQGVNEFLQWATGGNFDAENVVLGGTMGAGSQILSKSPADELLTNKGFRKTGIGSVDSKIDVSDDLVPIVKSGKELSESDIVALSLKAAKSDKGKKNLIKAMEIDPSVVANAKYLDVEDVVPIDVLSTDQMVKQLAQFEKKQPQSILKGQEITDLTELGRRMKVMMTEDLGAWEARDTMSDSAQSFMENQTNKLSKKADITYAEIKRRLPDAMPAEAPSIRKYFDDKFRETGGSAEGLEGLEKQIYNKFFGKNADPITYQGLDNYRINVIGPKTQMAKSMGSGDRGIAKHFYSLITDDQGLAADQLPELKKLWERGKRLKNAEFAIGENMEKIFGKELSKSLLPDLDKAMSGLKATNSKNLSNLMKTVPPRWRKQVMATGMLDAFGTKIAHGELNFNNFAKVVEGFLPSNTAKNIIYSNLPAGSAKKIKALGELSRSITDTINIKHGFTGASMQKAFDNVNGTLNKLLEVAKTIGGRAIVAETVTSTGGFPGTGLTLALGSAFDQVKSKKGGEAISALVADPMLRKMAVESITDMEAAERTAKAFAKKESVENFAKYFKITDVNTWLRTALRATIESKNEENNTNDKEEK